MSIEKLPEELERPFNLIFSGNKPNTEKCERIKRFVYSISQDVCRAVSQGRWKLSKHIFLCVTLRHLYRGMQLTRILNRLCHCESYSFGLELETAMAKVIDEGDTYLTPLIVTGKGNLVFHSEWDKLNKMLTNVTGPNAVNSAAGIMLQEQQKETTSSAKQLRPMLDRSKERGLKPDRPTVLPPKIICKRTGPVFPESAVLSPPSANDIEYSLCAIEDLVWFLCR